MEFPGCDRVLYRLPQLLSALHSRKIIHIVEGEKDVDRLLALGVAATCNPGGASTQPGKKWLASFTKVLAGADVVLIPDNDEVGRAFMLGVGKKLRGAGATVRLLALPDLPESGDVTDWLDNGNCAQDLAELVCGQSVELDDLGGAGEGESNTPKKPKPTQADILVQIGKKATLFHDDALRAFASYSVGSHRETWPVKGEGFRQWLRYSYFLQSGRAPGSQALQHALETIEAVAMYEGDRQAVGMRVVQDGENIYVDLADPDWRVVRCGPGGWEIMDHAPAPFERHKNMLPLPAPVPGGCIQELRPFINVTDEDWPLIVAFIVGVFRPRGPYPLLALQAEQDSSKSTIAKVIMRLVDPGIPMIRRPPADERDLMIAAKRNWAVAYDNISYLPLKLSDALCALTTGAGYTTRELYSDSEETVLADCRPVILNGIPAVVSRGDLLDRTILVHPPRLKDADRKEEAVFWAEFDMKAPYILGAILDLVCSALKHQDCVALPEKPRMADFARWICAAELAAPWENGLILSRYKKSRGDMTISALDADPVGAAVWSFVRERAQWVGSAGELLKALDERNPSSAKSKSWPKARNTMGSALRRLAPLLRRAGCIIDSHHTKTGNVWQLEWAGNMPSQPSAPSPGEGSEGCSGVDSVQPEWEEGVL